MLEHKKGADFAEWYLELVQSAELMDYAPVQGCAVIRERAYAVWEKIAAFLNARFKEDGVANTYFPLFIPESLLKKEAEHFHGFSPEVAWVTEGGGERLGERVALRPTSETIMYSMFSKWISSHRDLPYKINQWCNVVRWDTKTLKPFLRTREFLWQEGHTAHASKSEADAQVLRALYWYKELCEKLLAVPVFVGAKTDAEKFPGADYTTTLETLAPDGKAVQCGTSHGLGQNFAKIFGVRFKTADEGEEFVWQTSWGVSTRLIGVAAMIHGDDKGLVLPPKVAGTQVVIVPIYYDAGEKKLALISAEKIKAALEEKGVSVLIDSRDDKTPGFKFNEWELKGVPLRIEIGLKDLAKQGVTIARRDNGEKDFVSDEAIPERVPLLLEGIQENLFVKAKKFLDEGTRAVASFDEFKATLEERKGFVVGAWCGDARCEEAVKEETGASIRLIPFEDSDEDRQTGIRGNECVYCGQPSRFKAFFARSY